MSAKSGEPLRGEAAWKAEKERIAKKNEATYARGRQQRLTRDAEAAGRRRVAERKEAASRRGQTRGG